MVIFSNTSDEQAFCPVDYRLVKTDDGRVLMTRRLRAVDAEQFNRQWSERGIPTRWERTREPIAV
jgi:hypothetical protein